MIRGFFFDLDGTLVDTHEANYQAYKRALADFGVEITLETFKETIGLQAKNFLPKLAPHLNDDDIAAITEHKARYYKDLLHLSRLNHDLIEFIEEIKQDNQVVLVTTAKRGNGTAVLEHHKLSHLFSLIVFGDEVEHSKPHPEAYLKALKVTGLKAKEVIAFEDSESGKQAAKAARIPVIMINDFQI